MWRQSGCGKPRPNSTWSLGRCRSAVWVHLPGWKEQLPRRNPGTDIFTPDLIGPIQVLYTKLLSSSHYVSAGAHLLGKRVYFQCFCLYPSFKESFSLYFSVFWILFYRFLSFCFYFFFHLFCINHYFVSDARDIPENPIRPSKYALASCQRWKMKVKHLNEDNKSLSC